VDWIDLAEDTEKWGGLIYTVINLCVPYNSSEILDNLTKYKISFSRRALAALKLF
jgi:hypothetical protein